MLYWQFFARDILMKRYFVYEYGTPGSQYTDCLLRPVTVYGQVEGSQNTDKTVDLIAIQTKRQNVPIPRHYNVSQYVYGLHFAVWTAIRIPRPQCMPIFPNLRNQTIDVWTNFKSYHTVIKLFKGSGVRITFQIYSFTLLIS